MKCLSPIIASSAIALVLAATGPALAQYSSGAPSAKQTTPSGVTTASVTGAQKIPVTQIPNAQQINGAPVLDSTGKQFGRVIGIKTASSGKPDRVKVGFTTSDAMGRAASIRADRLTLDPSKQAVVADLSPSEVAQLASSAGSMSGAGGMNPGGSSAAGGSSGGGKGQY